MVVHEQLHNTLTCLSFVHFLIAWSGSQPKCFMSIKFAECVHSTQSIQSAISQVDGVLSFEWEQLKIFSHDCLLLKLYRYWLVMENSWYMYWQCFQILVSAQSRIMQTLLMQNFMHVQCCFLIARVAYCAMASNRPRSLIWDHLVIAEDLLLTICQLCKGKLLCWAQSTKNLHDDKSTLSFEDEAWPRIRRIQEPKVWTAIWASLSSTYMYIVVGQMKLHLYNKFP